MYTHNDVCKISYTHDKLVLFSLYGIQGGATALLMASQKGHTAAVQLLLIHGAKADIQDNVHVYINSTHAQYACIVTPCACARGKVIGSIRPSTQKSPDLNI
jgi:hypothetical protein